jgi:hypothetical protein
MSVNRSDADSGAPGDLIDRHAHSLLSEENLSRLKDLSPVPAGVCPLDPFGALVTIVLAGWAIHLATLP